MAGIGKFFDELKRRNVLRAGALYAAAVWALAQGLAQLLPLFGAYEWAARWFVIAGIIGFPFWVAFAWFYEFTPTGLKREDEIAPGDSTAHSTKRKLDFWIIGVLAVAVVLLVTNQLVPRPRADAHVAAPVRAAAIPAKSIAVLPLTNDSGDPKQDYFSDGLSEELIADLTQINELKVIGKRSSFQFRESTDSPATIGNQLGVATLLEGSVYQLDNRVRITISLIRTSDGSSLWAQTYDRELKDIFAVQSEIGHAVASALQVKFLGNGLDVDDKPPSGNVEAYVLMMRGRDAERRASSTEEFRHSIALLQRAIGLDPDYAYAWAVISTTAGILGNNLSGEARQAAYLQARTAADKAQALAPDAPATYRARGYLLANLDYDSIGALAQYQKAFARSPNDSTSMAFLASALANVGQLLPAIKLYRNAIITDPMRPDFYANLAITLLAQGLLDEAEQATRTALQRQPDYPGMYSILSTIDIVRGNPAAALNNAKQETDSTDRRWSVVVATQVGPDQQRADATLQDYIADNGKTQPYAIADMYALRRQPDQMFVWLNRAWTQRDPNFTQLLHDPFPLAYQDDPRFRTLCKQAHLPLPGQLLPAPPEAPLGAPSSIPTNTTP